METKRGGTTYIDRDLSERYSPTLILPGKLLFHNEEALELRPSLLQMVEKWRIKDGKFLLPTAKKRANLSTMLQPT